MLRYFLAAFVGLISTSCATITRGTTEALEIKTKPVGATAKINPTGEMCQTHAA